MTKHDETPVIPPESEPTEPAAPTDAEPPPEEPVINAKEAARRRSKEDLARKRQGLHRSRGKR